MSTDKMLKLPEVMEITGLKKSTIYANIKEGTFPKQVKLTKRSVRWRESDIVNFNKGISQAS